MDLDAFVAEHDAEWRRLERLAGSHRLSAAEADELVVLYQRAATHLSTVRSRTPDPALVSRLSRLVLSGRAAVTRGGGRLSWADLGRFLTVGFPLAVYRAWPWCAAVATAFTGLSFFLMWWVAGHPESGLAFLDPEAAQELVDSQFAGYYSEYAAPSFAFSLWTHNAWLAVQCLASGVLIVPVLWLLWTNALNIGVTGGIMISYGEGGQFFGLITPHGLLELTGIYVAAGVGLWIGWAWIAPPAHLSRARSLAAAGRSGLQAALGLVGLFAVSGLIEAFVTPSPLPTLVKVAVGALAWLSFLTYVAVLGPRATPTPTP